MKKIAFFDFDNTIYDGYSYQDFIDFTSKNILKNNKFQCKTYSILKNTSDYNKIVIGIANIIGEIIKGWKHEKFIECCKKSCNRSKILDWVIPVTEYLTLNDFQIYLVTASFEEMLIDSLQLIHVDKAFCSYFEKIDGIYDGKIKLLLTNDKKIEAINNVISFNNTFSLAFGDSIGDLSMLDSVNMAFLVRSYDKKIETIARQKEWNLGSNPEVIINKIKKKLTSFERKE